MKLLTTEQLYKAVPSLFTRYGAGHTSERYTPIATSDVIESLQQEGFYPTEAKQSATRRQNNPMFAKHMVRFRHRDYHSSGSGLFPELVLINSHDGCSSYRLMVGLYRVVCTNGLIAGHTYNEIRVKHQGDVIDNVIEGTYQMIESSSTMLRRVEEMKTFMMSEDRLIAYSIQAHSLRFGDDSNLKIEPSKLLSPRRREDTKYDLFTVFNVVQENLIKGKVLGLRMNDLGYWMRAKSRAITSIDQNIKINRELWTLTEQFLKT